MFLPMALVSLLLFPALGDHGAVRNAHYRVGRWILNIRTDRFADERTCRLSRPGVTYERQALVFHLPPRLDTTTAIYRIDDAPPVAARNDLMQLAHLGFALQNDDLANPSEGLVRIPADRLASARTVKIEARAFSHPFTFKIDGFGAAKVLAEKVGCPSVGGKVTSESR